MARLNTLATAVLDELCSAIATSPVERRAELSVLLRFAGTLRVVGGRPVVDVEVDYGPLVHRVGREVFGLFGCRSRAWTLSAGGGADPMFVVRVGDGVRISRWVGLIDSRGQAIPGLPLPVARGSEDEIAAGWRGAFLARGRVETEGRNPVLAVACPDAHTALALAGAAHRLGVPARARRSKGVERVEVTDAEGIATLLSCMGARENALIVASAWPGRVERRATGDRLAELRNANDDRSKRAAEMATARVERAVAILGEELPGHLAEAAALRIKYREVRLAELGQLADPPLTKHAVAGRIRRLIATADRQARRLGIPDTAGNGVAS